MTRPIVAHVIAVASHGRYLVREALETGSTPLLVGFHGYMETADTQMERLAHIPGADRWVLVSIQGLNRFYHRQAEQVVANWMTRQDREVAITDNNAYVSAVVETVRMQLGATGPLVFAGFSQGVAMTFRAACASTLHVAGVVALGGDVPPELDRNALALVRNALMGRGERDGWYTAEKRAADVARLRDAQVNLEAPVLDAAHEWTADFSRTVGVFLDRLA